MKRSNWFLLILLAIVTSVYLMIDKNKNEATEEATPVSTQIGYLIQETNTVLQRIRIYDNDYHIVEMVRGQDGLWTVSLPLSGEADQSKASAAESQIGALQIVSDLGLVTNLADFGILVPSYTVKLTYMNGVKHKLEVGNQTPTSNGYYIQLDDGKISIVSIYSIDAIVNLIENPPFPSTPTPEPTSISPQ